MSASSKFKTKAQLAETVETKAMSSAPAMEPKQPGKVYTFYSFKGGVGRSMAMANIATLIASEGRKVLVVDWDLEAPGLEHYFFKHDAGLAERMKDSLGVVDLLTPNAKGGIAEWRDCITQIKMRDVQLDFMQSGKRTRSAELYTQQVQGLDWQSLYDDHDIGARFDQIRQEWLLEYDYVFLDSRTGVTDIGDLCTVVLPDHLVLLFVTNTQNVQGIKDIYDRVQAAHERLPSDRMQLTALPLLSRDEFYSEHAQSTHWRRQAAGDLAEIYEAWLPENVRPHEAIQKLFVPYYAIWSFGEALPVMDDPDAIDNPASINAAFSRVSHLIQNDLNWSSLDRLSTPDAGGQAIKAQAVLEERQAELEEEYKARAKRTRQATGIGMLAIFALVIGLGYWLYSSAVTSIRQDADAQLAQLKETLDKTSTLESDLDKERDRRIEAENRLSGIDKEIEVKLAEQRQRFAQQIYDAEITQTRLKEVLDKTSTLETDLKQERDRRIDAENRLSGIDKEIEVKLAEQRQGYAKQLSDAEISQTRLTEQLANARAQQEALQKELDYIDGQTKGLSAIQADLERLTTENEKYADQIAALTTKNERLQAYQTQAAEARGRITALRDQIAALETNESKSVAACRLDLSNTEKQIGGLEEQVRSVRASLEKAAQLADSRQIEISQLRSELAKYPGTDPGIKDQLAALQGALDKAKRTIDEQEQDIAKLKNALESAQNSNGASSADLKRLQGQLDAANRKINDYKSTIRTLEQKLKAASSSSGQVDALTSQIRGLRASLEKANSNAENAKSELIRLKRSYDADVGRLKTQITSLTRELRSCRRKIQ